MRRYVVLLAGVTSLMVSIACVGSEVAGQIPASPSNPNPFDRCDCSGNRYDCSSFGTQSEAQSCFDFCLGQVGLDVHNLDVDGDGQVCEDLPDSETPRDPGPPDGPAGDGEGQEAQVIDVIDGDTIDVLIDGQRFRVRYIGVNTPELDEPCYGDATAANAALVSGQTVRMITDVSETDRYGRLLRYVFVDTPGGEVFVNAALVEQGWAESRRYDPDTAYAGSFDLLEEQAAAQGLGCWSTGVFD